MPPKKTYESSARQRVRGEAADDQTNPESVAKPLTTKPTQSPWQSNIFDRVRRDCVPLSGQLARSPRPRASGPAQEPHGRTRSPRTGSVRSVVSSSTARSSATEFQRPELALAALLLPVVPTRQILVPLSTSARAAIDAASGSYSATPPGTRTPGGSLGAFLMAMCRCSSPPNNRSPPASTPRALRSIGGCQIVHRRCRRLQHQHPSDEASTYLGFEP